MAKQDMSGWIMPIGMLAAAYLAYQYVVKQCAAGVSTGVIGTLCGAFSSTPAAASGATIFESGPSATTPPSSGSGAAPSSGPPASSAPDPYALAIAHLKAAAGGNSENYDQWAWYWENSGTFPGAPNGFGVTGAATSPSVIAQIITAGGGGNAANNWAGRTTNITAEQFVQDLKQAQGLSGLTPYAEIGIPSWMIHGGYHA